MPRLTVNFGDMEEFEALPAGEYACEVSSVEVRQKEDGEYPYLRWDFEVIEEGYEGRHVFNNTSLSPRALFRLLPVLEAIEVIDEDFDIENDELPIDYDEETGEILEPDMAGLTCIVVVSVFREKGTKRKLNDVVEILPMPAAPVTVKRKAVKKAEPEELDDDEEDVVEEPEEEEEPAPRKKAVRKPARRVNLR